MVAYASVDDVSVTDPRDARIADYRGVGDGELMRSRGLFVAEGRLVVERLLEDHRYHVRSVLVNPASRAALDEVLSRRLGPRAPTVYVAPTEAFAAIAGVDFHRGCLALAERPAAAAVGPLLSASSLIVVLEAVTNADNVGGVFRNAAAFGVDAVLLSPTCCDPLYRKAIRTSMGAALRVPFGRMSDWPASLRSLKDAGLSVVALTPRRWSLTLEEYMAARTASRIALVVGTEGPGMSREAEALADHRVSIPMKSDVDSLNLAVAVGIALSRLTGR